MVDVELDRITHTNNLIRKFDPSIEIKGFKPPPLITSMTLLIVIVLSIFNLILILF